MSQFLVFEQFWQYCVLGWQASSFSILKIDQLTAFWFPRFLMQNLLGYWGPVWGASLNAFKISVPFKNLIVSGGCLSYLELKSLGCLWSLIHLLRDLLSHYFFKYSCPFSSLSSPSETPTMHMLLFMVFHRSLRFYFNIKLFFSQ